MTEDPYRHDPPDTTFGAWLRTTKSDLPKRYRSPGHRPTQFRAPRSVPLGLGLTAAALVVLAVLMWIGK